MNHREWIRGKGKEVSKEARKGTDAVLLVRKADWASNCRGDEEKWVKKILGDKTHSNWLWFRQKWAKEMSFRDETGF